MVGAAPSPNPSHEVKLSDLYTALAGVRGKSFRESTKGNSIECSFSRKLKNVIGPLAFDMAQLFLKGSIVIDLGCGTPSGNGERLAVLSGAKGYLGIDKFNTRDSAPRKPYEDSEIQCAYVRADMLEALKMLPDESGSISITNIDAVIIRDDEYRQAVALEIARVVKPGGIIITNSFDVLMHLPGKIVIDGQTFTQGESHYTWEAHYRVRRESHTLGWLKWSRVACLIKK
ncbi:MAG: class I SAM-dependent methyltransferase [Bdellovibrionales bacterium]|nr:class I SAM-dependent methyltransferase [Bdellovibrionales bacterium]